MIIIFLSMLLAFENIYFPNIREYDIRNLIQNYDSSYFIPLDISLKVKEIKIDCVVSIKENKDSNFRWRTIKYNPNGYKILDSGYFSVVNYFVPTVLKFTYDSSNRIKTIETKHLECDESQFTFEFNKNGKIKHLMEERFDTHFDTRDAFNKYFIYTDEGMLTEIDYLENDSLIEISHLVFNNQGLKKCEFQENYIFNRFYLTDFIYDSSRRLQFVNYKEENPKNNSNSKKEYFYDDKSNLIKLKISSKSFNKPIIFYYSYYPDNKKNAEWVIDTNERELYKYKYSYLSNGMLDEVQAYFDNNSAKIIKYKFIYDYY